MISAADDAIVVLTGTSVPLSEGRRRRRKSAMMKPLPTSQLDHVRVDTLTQFILAVAAEQDEFRDRELGPIHLVKYV